MVVQAGTFHNLTEPDQLPVANTSPFGAIRTREIGRSSPICEPRFENVYKMGERARIRRVMDLGYLYVGKYAFPNVNDPT